MPQDPRVGEGDQKPPIQPTTPQQPEVQGAEPSKAFSLSQGAPQQVGAGMQTALKQYLKSGMNKSSWTDPQTGTTYKISTGKDPNPPKGDRNAVLTTVTAYAKKGGAPTGKAEFSVVTRQEQYHEVYNVYSKPNNTLDQSASTQKLTRIPNNLGELMRADPDMGQKLYHAIIVGIAMRMMKDMRKKQQHMFKGG